jgi:hypothetical protein
MHRRVVCGADEQARRFYRRFGLEVSLTDDVHLLVLVKDLRKTFGM